MNVLVTGASGFVGGRLAQLLIEKGHQVTALVRRTSVRKALQRLPGIKFADGDLLSGDGLESAVEGIDVVQHVAGVVKGRTEADYLRCNAAGTRLLCEAMAKQKNPPRLVYCSSLAAAGPSSVGKPKTEADISAPISMYGRSKLAGEQAVRELADRVPSVIVRPPFVYGPGDLVNLPPLMTMGRLGLYVKAGFGPKHFSFIHVDDLCEALILAGSQGKTLTSTGDEGIYYVADPQQYSWEDFCATLTQAMGKRWHRVIPLPEIFGYVAGVGSELGGRLRGTVPIMSRDKAREMKCEAWTCTPDRARQEIAFNPVHSLQTGLQNTVAWYRQEGLLR